MGLEHVAGIAEVRNSYEILLGKPETKGPIGDQDLCGRILLKWILKKY
jgi:hypothetical protein